MSATLDQIDDDGDCAAMLRAMAHVYQRYGSDAVDLRAELRPAHDAPVRDLS